MPINIGTYASRIIRLFGDAESLKHRHNRNNRRGAIIMQKPFVKFAATLVLSLFAAVAIAQERGTANEAKALVDKALAHVKEAGREKAFKDFTENADGKWRSKDLYVFAVDDDGVMQCHGASKALVGKDMKELKDAKGKSTVLEMRDIAKAKGNGWYEYEWTDPVTKKNGQKATYVARVPGWNGYIGVGIYKQ